MILKIFRPASAMIELIFAIVVMGIALLSAPMMLETAGKSNNVAFEQESIAIVAAQVSSMLTYAWDEQNTQNYAPNSILIVSTGDPALDGDNDRATSLRRLAIANASTGIATFGMNKENETTGSVIHFEAIPDDVDDFDNTESNLTVARSGNQVSQDGDIMDTSVKMRTQVTYLNDTANYNACANITGCDFSKSTETAWAAVGSSTNIKLITTTLSSSNVVGKKIKLHAFMCNIGAAIPQSKGGF